MKWCFITTLRFAALFSLQAATQTDYFKENRVFDFNENNIVEKDFRTAEDFSDLSSLSEFTDQYEKDILKEKNIDEKFLNKPLKPIALKNFGPMLKVAGEQILVNKEVLDDKLFKECLQLVEYMYFGTKRYTSAKRIYDDAFRKNGTEKPTLFQTIKDNGITIASSFFGTNGKTEGTEIGMIAYRKLPAVLQLFVVLEGSQGEDFEFLGGFGGASWLTNFQAKKVTTKASETFDLDEKYLLKGDGKLSYHEGFLEKISGSNRFFRDAIYSVLNETFGIVDRSKKISKKDGLILKDSVDKKRGFTVQVYILGHSQGGGLVQVAAPYYTTYIGQYLYGQNFDNEIFNTVHAICLSPARAIGDKSTLNVIERVMGKGNIFGYCSPMDPVPCVPLGSNIDGHKAKGIGFTILRKLAKILSHFVEEKLSTLLKAISGVNCHYEDLSIFAYEDYNDVLKRYTDLSIEALRDIKKQIATVKILQRIQENGKKIREHLKDVQENYFESHNHKFRQDDYLAKAAYHLVKVFKYCPPANYLAAQHFGTYTCLKWKDKNGKDQSKVDALFNHQLFEGDVQKAIDRGIDYNKHKASFLKK